MSNKAILLKSWIIFFCFLGTLLFSNEFSYFFDSKSTQTADFNSVLNLEHNLGTTFLKEGIEQKSNFFKQDEYARILLEFIQNFEDDNPNELTIALLLTELIFAQHVITDNEALVLAQKKFLEKYSLTPIGKEALQSLYTLFFSHFSLYSDTNVQLIPVSSKDFKDIKYTPKEQFPTKDEQSLYIVKAISLIKQLPTSDEKIPFFLVSLCNNTVAGYVLVMDNAFKDTKNRIINIIPQYETMFKKPLVHDMDKKASTLYSFFETFITAQKLSSVYGLPLISLLPARLQPLYAYLEQNLFTAHYFSLSEIQELVFFLDYYRYAAQFIVARLNMLTWQNNQASNKDFSW